jgi:hypothetical protein
VYTVIGTVIVLVVWPVDCLVCCWDCDCILLYGPLTVYTVVGTVIVLVVWTVDCLVCCRDCDCILLYGLIDYLRFYVPLKNISLIWRCHHCR